MPDATRPDSRTLDEKELLRRHPLFTRLSGQVIWLLFEEHGAAPDDIDAFMDQYVLWRDEQLGVFKRLLSTPDGMLRIRADQTAALGAPCPAPCPTCERLNGLLVAASDPRLLDWLPPYSLGCRARATFVAADEPPGGAAPIDTAATPPPRSLHCPSGWIFTHPWAKE
ncbi:MAG: hypothetical protein AB7E47_01045 [Desulfovibrionaceae bacterium]